MLFDFPGFIDSLREKPEKQKMIEKYEELFGPITGDSRNQIRYQEYVSQFTFHEYKVPEDLKNDYDWTLLLQLILASFSSESYLDKIAESTEYDLVVAVKSGEQSVVKKISELRQFQVTRLYEIYIEEQMNLQILMKEEEKEREAIVAQRGLRIQKWKLILEQKDQAQLKEQAETQQKEQLTDLYSQL
jgi:hypothetical protein